MLDSIMGYKQTQSILSDTNKVPIKNNILPPAQKDTVFISEEARKLLEEMKLSAANAKDVSFAESSKKSLLQEFRDYVKNPTLAHALEKMKGVVDDIDLGEAEKKVVYGLIERTFRSGIPEEGQLTNDALDSLKKELKKSEILSDDQLNNLMKDISELVSLAQEEDSDNPLKTDNSTHA